MFQDKFRHFGKDPVFRLQVRYMTAARDNQTPGGSFYPADNGRDLRGSAVRIVLPLNCQKGCMY